MNKKEFDKYLARDGACPHCGSTGADLIPHHRANRGMGGSKERNRPSNLLVFCALGNGLMESSPGFAALARGYGWKLFSHQESAETPVRLWSGWHLLGDDFSKVKVEGPE